MKDKSSSNINNGENVKAITIKDNEKFLRQISKSVNFNDAELSNDIKLLEKYCKENQILAMAAVQLGIPKRLIYLKNTNLALIQKMQINGETEEDKYYNEARILINPVVILKEGITDYWEACRSCLDNMGHVMRPYRIVVKYQDIKGRTHTEVFEGFESTVLSHELDHLDGILHIDIAKEIKVMSKEKRKKFRQTHDYNIISTTGNFEELVKKY